MASKLIIDPEAQNEIDKAIEWYESQQKGLGEDFLYYLGSYFNTLKNDNALFSIKREPVFRELPLKKFPYVIIYEKLNAKIIVYSVFNTHQNPKKKEK